jgi:hypothetical protein
LLSSDSGRKTSHDFGSSKIRAPAREICYELGGR